MSTPPLRLAELVATLALGQDNAFGQPLESQLRSCLLAGWLAEDLGAEPALRDAVYWVALLRFVGCTGHTHEVAQVFPDDIAIRAQTLVHDAANPAEVARDVIALVTAPRPAEEHPAIIEWIRENAKAWMVHNFTSGCEVADLLVRRLPFGPEVREALAFTFERWNGAGKPTGARGEAIPLAMRIVHLSHDMEAIARRLSPAAALAAAADRRDRTYDPALADRYVARGAEWLDRLARLEPWRAVLDSEPEPRQLLEGDDLDEALELLADFIDLKSPYRLGHSRRCATIGWEASRRLFGITALPNSILDKPGPLTLAERERVDHHPFLTEQVLRRTPALAVLNPLASAHHEREDGTGYPKGLTSTAPGARVLAAADAWVGWTTERADRPAAADADAAHELRALSASGKLDPRATEAVLAVVGQGDAPAPRRAPQAAGLSPREVEVLCLAAKGLTTAQIGKRLFISPKTTDHHIQHIYSKIGVSTRAAAALWAVQNRLIG
jgi:DNA-binding CsgD family transcriptional regulator